MTSDHNLIENKIMITSKATMDVLLATEEPGDTIALYNFYYYTAKWQNTNTVKATISYVSKALKWDEDRVRRTKKILIELGLIEDIRRTNEITKKVEGWYIKISYIALEENHPRENREGGSINSTLGKSDSVEKPYPNALELINKNALSTFSDENGDTPPPNNNISSLIKEKRASLVKSPANNRVTKSHQHYGLEISSLLDLDQPNKTRVMGFIKSRANDSAGHQLLQTATDLKNDSKFKRIPTQSEQVDYLFGVYRHRYEGKVYARVT